jgi:hypothetical protein
VKSEQPHLQLAQQVANLFASLPHVIFAVSRQLHPGEKRLVDLALKNCNSLPANMEKDIHSILLITATNVSGLPRRVARLLDRLDQMLDDEGFGSRPRG